MNQSQMAEKLQCILPEDGLCIQAPMREHTSFRIGGPAQFLALPETEEQIMQLIALAREEKIPYHIIGNGSNLLVSDDGVKGLVIKLAKNFSALSVSDDQITAQAGVLLSKLARSAAEESLTGLEFAAGIPGTLGGAVMMNAGAYGGEMKDVVSSVRYLDENGHIATAQGEALGFGYRKSAFGADTVILSASLVLKKGEADVIAAKIKELNNARREKQPIELPSAGSTFKRPVGGYAAKLIDEAGLSGFRIGDAAVSEKHCGFVVNLGNATCADVLALMEQVKQRVFENSGVLLEPEVRYLD